MNVYTSTNHLQVLTTVEKVRHINSPLKTAKDAMLEVLLDAEIFIIQRRINCLQY